MTLPLFWLYLWQSKEYRLDRMRSHWRFLSEKQRWMLLLWGKYRRPQFTLKLLLITCIAAFFGIASAYFFTAILSAVWIVSFVASWFLSAVWVSASVGLVWIIERPIKEWIVKKAGKKAKQLFKDSLVIGVTGSYGKTTTKEFIAQILAEKLQVIRTPSHVNYTLPLAQFINNEVHTTPNVFVVEYASYGPGNIAYDAQNVVHPNWAVLTGIAPQHIELFGSLENIMKAKFELVDALTGESRVFYNNQDKNLQKEIVKREMNAKSFGFKEAQIYLENLSWKDSLRGQILTNMFAANVSAAVMVAQELGLTADEIQRGVEKLTWLPHTLEVLEKKNITILDDSHGSNPTGFEKLIHFIRDISYPQKILVTNGVLELGAHSDKINAHLAKESAEVFYGIFQTNTALVSSWRKGTKDTCQFGSEDEIIDKLRDSVDTGALVVMEGRIPEKIRRFVLNNL